MALKPIAPAPQRARSWVRTATWLVVLAALCLAGPMSALACPSCAGNEKGGIGVYVAMACMILLPFGLFSLVVPYVKRGPRH